MFTVLNIKTHNSLLSSMIKIPALVKAAREHGLEALTITDDNMYGVIDFYKECLKNDIKPIVGLEVRLDEKFVLYCQNYNGYKNLIKIATTVSE
ncbi:MAG: PHP domain-containing protein, partial [Bacilli bacterium]|nr:PHP domain-containing protein [Bacilli bacterium]